MNDAAASWNRADFAKAIATVKSLEDSGNRFAFGISWKLPPAVSKINGAAIGTIGNASNPHLDAHNGTANNDLHDSVSSGGFLFALYRSDADSIVVFRWKPALASDVRTIAPYFEGEFDVSAYRDHVVIVHILDTTGSTGLRYWVSHDSGDTWSYGFLDPGAPGIYDVSQPRVTLRRGVGIAVAFQRDSVHGDDLIYMRTRGYSDQPWSDPVPVTDVGLSIDTQMDLDALPNVGLGIVSIHSGGIPWYDQTPLIFRNGFEFGDSADWD